MLRLVPIHRATLSTYEAASTLHGPLDLYHDSGKNTLELAACTQSLTNAGAPLPCHTCHTAVNPATCLDGARACGDGAKAAPTPRETQQP